MKPRLPIKSIRKFIVLILFFLLLSTLHSVSTIHAQIVSDSKLGVFILGQSNTAPTIVDSGPKVIKVMDPQSNSTILEYVREYKKKYPESIVVLRVYEGTVGRGYSLSDNPEGAAQDFWNGVLSPALAKLGSDKELFDYVSGPNEFDNTPIINSQESVEWTNRFWLQLAELIAGAGLRPLLGEIPVGNLGPEYLDGLVPSLQFIKSKGGAWSYHAYTLHYTTDISDEYYYSLRYRQFYEYFREKYPDLTDLPMILTEAGVDESGGPATSGWQARGDASKYKNWLMWFDSEIKKDQYILGSTIFQLGDSHWSSFNIEPLASWLASYLSGHPMPIEEGDTSTTSECDRSSIWGGLVDFFRSLARKLAQKKVGSQLKKVTEAGLPQMEMQDASVQDPACEDDEEVNTIPQVASRYTLASGMSSPHDDKEPVSTNLLANLIAFLGEIIGIVDKGDREAGEFVKEDLPGEVGDKIWAQHVKTNDLAQSGKDSQVLAVSKEKGEMMTEALSMKQCTTLPFGVGDCAESGTLLGSAEISPEVSPSPSSPGICPLGTGYCSVENLSRFFNNSDAVGKASQICAVESGGNPSALNDGCLIHRSADYSVGLFQINLLPSNRCPGAFSSYTLAPPSCTISSQTVLDECVARLRNPDENIRQAVIISGGGRNWSPWGAAKYCGIVQ